MLHVIDGQHTAIAACTHGGIPILPVVIIEGDEAERADAFVRHNRDRVNVTPMQLHYSMLAAGDDTATDIDRACKRANVRIRRTPPASGLYGPGETVAIAAIRTLVSARGPRAARRVLEICAEAQMAPITSNAIKAVEALLFSPSYQDEVDLDRLGAALRLYPKLSKEAEVWATERKVPRWRGLTSILFQNARKRHGRRSDRAA